MKLYIARDESGKLYLHLQEPSLNGNYFYSNDSWEIDKEMFPELTFENSPQKVNSN